MFIFEMILIIMPSFSQKFIVNNYVYDLLIPIYIFNSHDITYFDPYQFKI